MSESTISPISTLTSSVLGINSSVNIFIASIFLIVSSISEVISPPKEQLEHVLLSLSQPYHQSPLL